MRALPRVPWLLLVPAVIVPAIGALIYFVLFPEGVVGQTAYGITKVFLVLYPPAAVAWLSGGRWWGAGSRGGGTPPPEAIRPQHGRAVLLGLGFAVATAVLMAVLLHGRLGAVVEDGAGNIRERAEGLGFADHFLIFALFVSVVHSAIEEVYWRWFVFRGFRSRLGGGVAAHALAAAAFGAHHLVVLLQFFRFDLALLTTLGVAAGGAFWSWLYARTGSLVGPWVSHLAVDLALMAIGHRLIFS